MHISNKVVKDWHNGANKAKKKYKRKDIKIKQTSALKQIYINSSIWPKSKLNKIV